MILFITNCAKSLSYWYIWIYGRKVDHRTRLNLYAGLAYRYEKTLPAPRDNGVRLVLVRRFVGAPVLVRTYLVNESTHIYAWVLRIGSCYEYFKTSLKLPTDKTKVQCHGVRRSWWVLWLAKVHKKITRSHVRVTCPQSPHVPSNDDNPERRLHTAPRVVLTLRERCNLWLGPTKPPPWYVFKQKDSRWGLFVKKYEN